MQHSVDGCCDTFRVFVLSFEECHYSVIIVELLLVSLLFRGWRQAKIDNFEGEWKGSAWWSDGDYQQKIRSGEPGEVLDKAPTYALMGR